MVSSVPGAAWPSWSEDGLDLVFCDRSSTNANDGVNLWVAAADGSGLTQISGFADGTNGFPYGALWTPDATALTAAGTVFGTNGLWVIPIRADRAGCDGAPYRLPTQPGDAIDFVGSVIDAAPAPASYTGPLPGLHIRQAPGGVVVYWSTNAAGFTLELRVQALSALWQSVPGPYALNPPYYEYQETNSALYRMEWFRLRYTGRTNGKP